MKEKVKKRRRGKKNLNKVIIISIISIYFLSRMYPLLGASSNKTTIAQIGKLEVIVSGTGYIARDEIVYNNINEGEITYYVADGEKVTKGQKLAEVHMKNIDPKSLEELEIINLRIKGIQEKQNDQPVFEGDIKKLDNQINDVLKRLQEAYKYEGYPKIAEYQAELKALIDKKNIIAGEKSFAGKNLTQLQEQKHAIEQRVDSSIQSIYSDNPGVVAFGSDDLESLLNLKSIEQITSQDLETIKNSQRKSSKVSESKPHLRIIRDHRWSIVIELDNQQAEGIQANKNIKLRKQGEAREFTAFIRKIIADEEKSIIILDLSEVLEGYHSLRNISLDIIKSSLEGLMLPNQVIFEEEGQAYVYRIDVNGFTKKLPVKVIGSNREYSILQEGSFQKEVMKEEKKETVRLNTINLYDEVLLKGGKGSEGQRIR